MATLGLAMIVRDEAMVIERCLKSVKGLIDTWTIIDTGSRDNTPQIIERELDGIPGNLYRSEWKNFSHNRTELLDKARGTADWLLTLDADTTVTSSGRLPLTGDLGYVRFTGALDWALPWLVSGKSDRTWEYVGYAHEYITSPEPHETVHASGWTVTHHCDGGNQIGKLDRYLKLLQEDDATTPDAPRTVFYLANTYRELGQIPQALREYRRRLPLGGFEEEVFVSQLQLGLLKGSPTELLKAWNLRPHRAEPLYALAQHYRFAQQYNLGRHFAETGLALPYPERDLLFIERAVYDWGLKFERGVSSWYAGDPSRLRNDCIDLLKMELPPHIKEAVKQNLTFC